jgi:acyl-coenzyme A thioesterase PaaI-like protein
MVSLEELRTFFARDFPQSTVTLLEVGPEPGRAKVRQEIGQTHLRPGGTVSGPTMMAVADAASYAAVLTAIGIVPLAVTTNMTMNFLRRPSPDAALLAEASTLKLGKRLAVVDVRLCSEGHDELVAHAVCTYSIPDQKPDQKNV